MNHSAPAILVLLLATPALAGDRVSLDKLFDYAPAVEEAVDHYDLQHTVTTVDAEPSVQRREVDYRETVVAVDREKTPTELKVALRRFQKDDTQVEPRTVRMRREAKDVYSYEGEVPKPLRSFLERRRSEAGPAALAVLLPKGKLKVGKEFKVSIRKVMTWLAKEAPLLTKEAFLPRGHSASGTLVEVDEGVATVEVTARLMVRQLGPKAFDEPAPLTLVLQCSAPVDGSGPPSLVSTTGVTAIVDGKTIRVRSTRIQRATRAKATK